MNNHVCNFGNLHIMAHTRKLENNFGCYSSSSTLFGGSCSLVVHVPVYIQAS